MPIAFNRRGLGPTKTAVFRVDAGPGIGMGHFMRCRTLAIELLKRGWVVFFAGSGLSVGMHGLVSGKVNRIINLIEFGPFSSSTDDAAALLTLMQKDFDLHVDCLIIDTYSYKREDYAYFQRFCRQRVPVMVIDDLANRDTPAQVVLNPNPLFSPEPYQRQKIPHILCGEKYTLIRPEVVAQRDRPYSAEGVIMITLGGGDVVEPLLKVLRAVPKGLPNRICVSVSSACPLEPINAWIDEDPVMRFLNIDSDRFPDLLAGSAMTITGGGTTLWEAYCLGVPNICLVWVDNQRQTSVVIKQQATSLLLDLVEQIGQGLGSDLVAKGVRSIKSNMADATAIRQREQQNHFAGEVIRRDQTSFLIDSANEVDADLIGGILQEFRNLPEHWQEMMSRQRALIDGSGAARCADLLERIVWEPVDLLASDWRKAFENWTT